jgi:competence protein ComEC
MRGDKIGFYSKGVSNVISVVLIVAIVVALVSLVTLVVFNIGSETNDSLDATVMIEKDSGVISTTVLRNENVENIKILGPNGFERNIDSRPGSTETFSGIDAGEYSLIGFNEGNQEVLRTITVESETGDTSTLSGTVRINPNISGAKVVSFNSVGQRIDTNITDSNGKFKLQASANGDIYVNVEGFADYDSIPEIDNNLYTSVKLPVSSVRSNNGVDFSVNSSNLVTIQNVNGNKTADVLYQLDNGSRQIGNPWQLEASNKNRNKNYKLINDLDAEDQEFVSWDGEPVNSYAEIDDSINSVVGLSELSINWLDVGQADSIFIRSKSGDNMLIDSGDFQDNGEVPIDYLQKKGINRIDHLVATHQDADHIGGHADIIREFGGSGIGSIYDNNVTRTTGTAEDYVDAVQEEGLSITPVEEGDRIDFSGADIEILNPENAGGSSKEGNIVVLVVKHGENKMVFGGDMETNPTEDRLVSNYNSKIDADVLDVPHHGSSTSSSIGLIEAVDPDIGVISSPFDSQFDHPVDSVVQRYNSRGVDLYWTSRNGNITITSDGSSLDRSVERGSVNDVTKAIYEVQIKSSKTKAEPGEKIKFEYDVTNVGGVSGSKKVRLNVEGLSDPVNQSSNIILDQGETTTKNLIWNTSSSLDKKDYNIDIKTDRNEDSKTVTIEDISNIIANPSFELGNNEDANSWEETTTKDSGRSSEISFTGDYSLKMDSLTGSYGGRTVKSEKVSVTGGESYSIGVKYNLSPFESISDPSDYRYGFSVIWFDGSSAEIERDKSFKDFQKSGSWTEINITETAPPGAEFAKVRIRAKEDVNNNVEVFWDDAFLK